MPSPPPRRAWGTRYDSLVETPPSGSPIVTSPDVSLHSREAPSSVDRHGEVVRVRDGVHPAAEKERPVAEHESPQTSPAGVEQMCVDGSSPAQARMPHDASVFVASLPSHIPEADLQTLLSEHLSQHATIKHIKLIRDNRGTVCAFVQVESAAQAADLIAACNLSQFVDRHIRCERARAFRTLIVSWRIISPVAQGSDESQGKPQGEREAGPLRLRRCRGTKYVQVTHGNEALSSDPIQLPNYTPPRSDDPLSGPGIFFPEGVKEGDFKCLKSLLESFGPLEFITPFESNNLPPRMIQQGAEPQSREEGAFMRGGSTSMSIKGGEDDKPEPVRAQRPIWAVKWEHRNDAVSAITALQYIPNLFVCWSHTYGRPHQPPYSQYGPLGHSRSSSGLFTQPSYPSTPFVTNDPNTPHPPHQQTALDTDGQSDAQWAVVPIASGARLQQLHAQVPTVPKTAAQQQNLITFSESDFPPLTGEIGGGSGGMTGGQGRGKRGAWLGRKNFIRAGAPSPPSISTTLNSSQVSSTLGSPTSVIVPYTPDLESGIEPSPITSGLPVTPRSPSGGYVPQSDEMTKDMIYASAPGYITPSASRAGHNLPQGFPAPYTSPHSVPTRRGFEDGLEKVSDGRELFIGGLDVETWDEERVRQVFGQYGTIDEVRFVKPGYHAPVHRRAFAFVKYTDHEAPHRAIKEEHLRVYDERKIKVQLRDANPPKRWGYRGRARFHQGLLRTDRLSLDFEDNSTVGEPLVGAEEVGEPRDNGHVRFASAPEVGRVEEKDFIVTSGEESVSDAGERHSEVERAAAVRAEESPDEFPKSHDTESAGSCSDGAPDASMEVQNSSADNTFTLADTTVLPTLPQADSTQQEPQSEPYSLTVTSTSPLNPDAASNYAPSSTGSAPANTAYYAQAPSWIPPYAIPPSYGAYGYFPQQVPSQSADGSTAYPWMAALYRNVVPFVPWFNPPPGVELAPAPVRPTGYIQREPGGIFIPVYPPERLGQYMSTSSGTADQSQAQSQSGASSIGNWQNLPPHPQLYPVAFPMQQAVMVPQQGSVTGHQSQHPQQQQLPVAGNGWIAAPPGAAYHVPSSAPPPYPVPNSYYPPLSATAPSNSRQGMYGQYDSSMHQTPMKNHHRRGADYGHQPHRMSGNAGSREGRYPHPRRGFGSVSMNSTVEQSFNGSSVDPPWQAKANGGLSTQLGVQTSNSTPQWG